MRLPKSNLSETARQLSGRFVALSLSVVLFGGMVPGSALSQAVVIEGVVFQPGEWSKTIPGVHVPPGRSLQVTARRSLEWACMLPSVASMKTAIQNAMNDGSLPAKLVLLEKRLDGNAADIGAGIRAVMGGGMEPWTYTAPALFHFVARNQINETWSAGRPLVLTVEPQSSNVSAVDCLELSDARIFAQQLRGIIRRYLGLPPGKPAAGLDPTR